MTKWVAYDADSEHTGFVHLLGVFSSRQEAIDYVVERGTTPHADGNGFQLDTGRVRIEEVPYRPTYAPED